MSVTHGMCPSRCIKVISFDASQSLIIFSHLSQSFSTFLSTSEMELEKLITVDGQLDGLRERQERLRMPWRRGR